MVYVMVNCQGCADRERDVAALREALAWALAFLPTRTKRNNAHFQEKRSAARALLAPAPPHEGATS
jgi:hypothetical protein